MPPVFSSKKISGKPAYYYARNDTGHEKLKKLKASNISIYDIKINSFDGLNGNMSICCSSGTYIRSIINDIGNMLGCGATLTHLTRDSIGKFELRDSVDADDIEKIGECAGDMAIGFEENAGSAEKNAVGFEENAGSAEKNAVGFEENAGSAEKNAVGFEENAGSAKKNDDGAKQNCGGQNSAKYRAGIFSIEKILQLKYL